MENKMRVIKSSQNDVFSEYLKIMSKFNKRRSLVKSASLVSSITKGVLDAASVGAGAAAALSKNVEEISRIYSSGGIKGLMDLPEFATAAAKFDPAASRPSVLLKGLLGEAEYTSVTTQIIQKATAGEAGGAFTMLAKADDQAAFLDDLLRFEQSGTYEDALKIANLYVKEAGAVEKMQSKIKILDAVAPDTPQFRKQYLGDELNASNMPDSIAKELGLTPRQLDEINEVVPLKMLEDAKTPKVEQPKVKQPKPETSSGGPRDTSSTSQLDPASELKLSQSNPKMWSQDFQPINNQFDEMFNFGEDVNAIDYFVVAPDGRTFTQVSKEIGSNGGNLARNIDEINQASSLDELGEGALEAVVQEQKAIQDGVEGLKSNLGQTDVRIQTRISDSQQAVEQAIRTAKDSLSQGQVNALETIMAELAEQPGHVKAAMLDELNALEEAIKGAKAGKISDAQLKTLTENFSAKLKEAVKDLPTTKQIDEMLDAKLGKYKTDMDDALSKALKGLADKDPAALRAIKEAAKSGSAWWTGLKWLGGAAAVAGVLYLGNKTIGFLSQMQGKQTTPLPPPNMINKTNVQKTIIDFAEMNKLSGYYQATITCLTSTEIYQPGSGADQLAKVCLAAATDALAAYNQLKIDVNDPAKIQASLANFNTKNDTFIKEMARFGLYPNRSAELLQPLNPQDIQTCLGYQVTGTRIANDVANQISSLSTANQALQMSQQQGGGGMGGGAQMQGTTLNPFQGNVPMQNINNLYPIFGRQVIINMSGVQLQFSLAQFNMVPRRNISQSALDYRSLLTSGRVLNELEKSLNSTGKEFIADPDRFKVEGYMYNSPAFASMPPNVRSLRDVEAAALSGSQNAYNVLAYAVARHIRNTLEAGGLNQYIGGFDRGKGQRRNQIRSPGYGYMGDRADDLRRASEEKNKIIKESINNETNSDLKKFSDDFSKGYYKDAVKDLNSAEDSFLKEFYKSYGELSEYEPEAKKSESLYGLNEKGEDLVLEAHPQTANIADSRGKGGLVENGHEQHKRMQEMFGDMPTANFKGSYAKLKEQMKKHGY